MSASGVAWLYLLGAGILEIGWALGLKFTNGFTKPLPTAIVLIAAWISFWMLAQSAKVIPIGTAYAVWTGIGAAGTAVVGILFLKEPHDFIRIACIAAIIIGAAGLKLFARH